MHKKLIVILMVSFVFLSACETKKPEVPILAEPIGTDMDTAVVSRGDIYELITYDAKVYPEIQENSFDVNGVVNNIDVYLGQKVKKGDVLIRLDDANMKKELETLKAELEDVKINNEYNNMLKELDLQIIELNLIQKKNEKATEIDIALMNADYENGKLEQKQNFELQQYEIEKKQARIEEIKVQMNKNVLTASCTGNLVYIKELHRGIQISAKDTVVIIANESKLHIQSEYIQENVIKNASQIYALMNGKEYDVEYQPITTDERIKLNNGLTTIESRYTIENNKDFVVGDYAAICIKDKMKSNVLIIPKNALYSDAEGNFVYKRVDDAIERCKIEIGTQTNIQVEITSGLEEGDVVYVQG